MNIDFYRGFPYSLTMSGYICGTATHYTDGIRFEKQVDLATGPTRRDYQNVSLLYTIMRIEIFRYDDLGRLRDDEIQLVMCEPKPTFLEQIIPVHEGTYRACIVQDNELVELPFGVDDGTGKVYVDYTPIPLENQWRYRWRRTLPPGTLRQEPNSVPSDNTLVDIMNTWCIRRGERTTVPLEQSYSSAELSAADALLSLHGEQHR